MTTPRPLPLVIAHRGASGYRPEHTLAAYELAIDMGADFIESDLVATKDGVLIARHENEISKTTDVADHTAFGDRKKTKLIDGLEITGWFAEDFTLAEIKALRARERLPFRNHAFDGAFEVPTFAQILELVRFRSAKIGRIIGVFVETKHSTYFRSIGLPLEEPLLSAIEASGQHRRETPIYILSFETSNLRELRKRIGLPLIQLLEAKGQQPYDLTVINDGRTYGDLATPKGLEEIATYADAIGPNKRLIMPAGPDGRLEAPTALVKDAHRAGLVVCPWSFRSDSFFLAAEYGGDPQQEYGQFFSLGVDGVSSDFVDVAVHAREAWSGRWQSGTGLGSASFFLQRG